VILAPVSIFAAKSLPSPNGKRRSNASTTFAAGSGRKDNAPKRYLISLQRPL
jgi:hypothetical protein